jgi:ribosomal protein S18 acetylase RimI-like enzyme
MDIVSPTGDERLWAGYIDCRCRTLYRPFGLPDSCAASELDTPRERPEIIHRCVVEGGAVVACGRMDLQVNHPKGPRAQLRYFGVGAEQRGTGVAQALLTHLEDRAREAGITHVWMEARVAALGFYMRAGYSDVGVGPTKWGVIPHRILERAI